MKALKTKVNMRRRTKPSFHKINQDNIEIIQHLGFRKSATRLSEKLKKIERQQRSSGDGLNCKRRREIERNLKNIVTVKT
jgi:hypothetical protein